MQASMKLAFKKSMYAGQEQNEIYVRRGDAYSALAADPKPPGTPRSESSLREVPAGTQALDVV